MLYWSHPVYFGTQRCDLLKQRDPAVQTILQELRLRIERGRYQPGTWLPTERDLSEEFAVHRSVIRAALTTLAEQELIVRLPGRRPWVNELRHPTPKAGPQWRRSVQTQDIAAIMPQHTKFASALTILGGINHVLREKEAPCRLVIFDNYSDPATFNIEQEREALRSVLAGGAAGVVLWSMDVRQTLPEIQQLRDNGVPVVFVDRHTPDWDGDFVGVDNRQAAGEAVDYLLEQGHRRIAFVAGDEVDIISTTRDRQRGYHETLNRRGLAAPELIYILPHTADMFTRAANYFLEVNDPPTAVFANNDTVAYHLIGALEACGRRVPQDVSVIGFDDMDRFSPRPARLTTMRQPFEQMGRAAAELLLHRLQSEEGTSTPWRHVLLPTPLIVRETCCKKSL